VELKISDQSHRMDDPSRFRIQQACHSRWQIECARPEAFDGAFAWGGRWRGGQKRELHMR
jgi:hypothetical protein